MLVFGKIVVLVRIVSIANQNTLTYINAVYNTTNCNNGFRSPMRSSVSVILSSPTPDTNMSHPDYEQNAHDHATLLILIKQIGKYKY